MDILLPADRIQHRVAELARQIARDYQGKQLTIVGVLNGCLMFVPDLVRHLDLPLEIGFLRASSYRGETTRPGTLHIISELLPEVAGRNVLLLDDILDTGQTLHQLLALVKRHQPASLRVGVLLRKIGQQEIPIVPDYCGFDIPNTFVVGYGLDYDGEFRHLPYIAVLSEKSPLLRRGPEP
jgi:hypoxanthine phosphoribosyltransferase